LPIVVWIGNDAATQSGTGQFLRLTAFLATWKLLGSRILTPRRRARERLDGFDARCSGAAVAVVGPVVSRALVLDPDESSPPPHPPIATAATAAATRT
jgi:hypothetical protein